MKKVFKILSIIVVVVIIGIGLYIGWIYLLEQLHYKKLDRERINGSTTLSKYIEYHDIEHTRYYEEELSFFAKSIKCDLLKEKDILYYFGYNMGNGYLILDDYSIYKTAFKSDKTYSNGQQCKQIANDTKLKRFQLQNGGLYFISENNKYYDIDPEKEDVREIDFNDLSYEDVKKFINKENIKKIQYLNRISGDNAVNASVYAVLKDDGQIYEQQYQYKYNIGKYVMISEKVLYSNEDYGNITDFIYNYMGEGNSNNGIYGIVSDKGLFYLKQTDDQKYIDTEKTYEMVSSDIYSKYKNDVKYVNGDYIFTVDNNIIKTNMICRDIDKEIK